MEILLEEMSVAELVEHWNGLRPDQPLKSWKAGKAKLIARIRNEVHAAAFLSAEAVEAPDAEAQAEPEVAEEAPAATEEPVAEVVPLRPKAEGRKKEPAKEKGPGVGEMARGLIVARPDLSFQQIADLVNEALGSKATAASCRWYAMDMRRKGVEVPARVKTKLAAAADGEVEE